MDICAVANASDKVLEELGLARACDRLKLTAYYRSLSNSCGNITSTKEEYNKTKRALLESFLSRKKVTRTSRKGPNNELSLQKEKQMSKIKKKKVYLGWKHFQDDHNAYVLVSLVKGGGSRTVNVL